MAVEIPVYVDIQGAFDRAISQIPKEIPKLEKVLSQHALKMKIDIGGEDMSIRRILTDTTLSAKDLERALRAIRRAFDDAVVKDAKKARTSATVNNLAKSYGLLEQRIKGVYDSNTVAAMRLEDTIAKVTFKIQDLKAKLATLTPGTDQFSKMNYEMMLQQKRLGELTRQHALYKAGVDASNTSLLKQSSIVRQLTGYFSGLYAVHTVVRFVKNIRDVTGELEYQRVALGHILQDVNYGNNLFDRIIEAAKQSPFRITQLVTYTKQLAAYRIEQENLYDTTMRLADISAGLGVDMQRLILAYGQVRAASVLRGQELRQFTEAGIPLVEELAKKFTKLKSEMVSTADVFRLISERAVPFEYIKEIFEEMTDAGGIFYKMQEEQAKTLKGRWEKLKDAYDQALMRLGDSETFQSWNDTVLKILNGVANNLTGIVRIVNAASIGWITYKIATSNAAKSMVALGRVNIKATASMIRMFGVVGTLRAGVTALGMAWKRFVAALSANWVGLLLTAGATLITYFTTFGKKTKEATAELSDMQRAIERMKDANKEFEYGKGLVDSYEELAQKTNRTSKESETMLDTLKELERAFPGLTSKINDDNLSLEERIGLMRDAIKASHDLAVEEAKNRLNTQKEIIRGLEDDEKAARLEKDSAQRRLEAAQTAEKVGYRQGAGPMGVEIVSDAKQLKQETIEAAKAAKAAEDAYDKIAEKLAEARREEEQLNDLAFPGNKTKEMAEWQSLLSNYRKYTSEGLTKEIFTEADIKSWDSLGEAIKKLKPLFKEAKESYEGLVSAVKQGGDLVKPTLIKERDSAKAAVDAWDRVDSLLGGQLSTSSRSSGGGYKADPFIAQMQERMKFMQDFKKGYDEFNKYLSKSDALAEQASIMEKRGLSLGVNVAEQKRAAEELADWYAEAREKAFEQAKTHGATGTIDSFLSQEIKDTGKNAKALKDFQKLLQSLWDAETEIRTDKKKKEIEDALQRLSDEIKRTETARNFYNNILDLTGDEQLAATMGVSVYGDIGSEFKERMQEQLEEAMKSIDPDSLTDELKSAFEKQDFDVLLKNLDKFPQEWQKRLKDMAESDEKYTADLMKNFADLISKYGDATQKIATIKAKTKNEIDKVNEAFTLAEASGKLTPEELKALKKRRDEIVKTLTAQQDLDEFKQSDDYIKFFSELNVMTTKQAVLVRGKLREAYYKAFHEGAINADELRRNLRAVDEQFKKLNEDSSVFTAYLNGGIEGAIRKLQDYSDTIGTLAQKMKSGKNLDDGERAFANQMFERFGSWSEATEGVKSIGDLVSKYGGDMSKAGDAMGQMGEAMGSMAANGPSALAIVDAIIKAVNSTIVGIQQIIDQLNEVRSEDKKIGGWFSYLSDFNKYAFSGWEKLKSGDLIGATTDVVSSLVSVGINIKKTFNKKYDKRIEAQAKLIEDLQYEYSRLGVAIEDAFGSDYVYNYNQQMEILQAQAEAYRKQAELERKKGKSGDESKAQEYEKAERDIRDQITDMQGQLAEFFTGTDLTSAARDFAQAWIEAYKEFGSTTDAMREKFDEMIENMVVNSLAARLVQGILKPIFDEIDKAAGEGDLSAQKIGEISALVPTAIEKIDNSLGTMVSQLSAAGINLRQQAGQFTGISRDIAGASEESILGLSAGINTANFYMSYLPAIAENVAALRAYIVGDAAATVRTTASEGPTYEDQMLGYAANLPMMRDDMYAIRSLLEKVIKPVGTAYYVSVR